nr:ribonuclease H-like domain-containing protein [Tanacetum cinerariifolium]
MESLSPQVISAAKLPILNPNEFDIWKMRIEQYFLMTDYLLWKVILNGDSPAPTRVVDGVLQPVAPTTTEQRLAKKNELKAMAIEKRFGGNTDTKKVQKALLKQLYENFIISSSESLDQIHDRLQKLISQLEILGVSLSQEDINLKFLRSLPSEWRTHTLICRNKTDLEEQSLDDLFNSLKIDADDLEEIDLKWQMAMLIMRARRFLQRTGRNLGANGPTSMGFDMSKVECYNCHRKRHFARECRSPKDTRRNEEESANYALMAFSSSSSSSDNEVASCSKACLESVEARLLVYKQNESVFEEDIKLIKLEVQLRDNALVSLRQTLEKVEQERDDLKLKLEKFQTSSKNLTELLASQTNAKTGSDESLLPSPIYDRYQLDNGYHAVPPPYTVTFMPPKPDLVFNNAPTDVETDYPAVTVKLSPTKPDQDLSLTNRSSAPIIEDCVSDSEDEFETKTSQNVPSFVQPSKQVKSPGHSVQHDETSILAATPKPASPKPTSNGKSRNRKACFSKLVPITAVRPVSTAVPKISVPRPRHAKPITRSPSPKASNSPLRVTAVKAPVVNAAQVGRSNWEIQVSNGLGPKENLTILFLVYGNPQHALKDKGVIDSGCSRHMTRNMSYLSDFEELNDGYVAFCGNPKGGKISGKGKIRTGKLDFDVYFVKELKFNLFSVSQMCDKKNNVLFTETECLVLSLDFKLLDKSQVLLRVPKENNMYNVNLKNIVPSGDLTCLFEKATLDESNLWH